MAVLRVRVECTATGWILATGIDDLQPPVPHADASSVVRHADGFLGNMFELGDSIVIECPPVGTWHSDRPEPALRTLRNALSLRDGERG